MNFEIKTIKSLRDELKKLRRHGLKQEMVSIHEVLEVVDRLADV